MAKKTLLWPALMLSFCTTDPLPDEDYELPTSSFPFLGTVPERPGMPDTQTFVTRQQCLQNNHDHALARKNEKKQSG